MAAYSERKPKLIKFGWILCSLDKNKATAMPYASDTKAYNNGMKIRQSIICDGKALVSRLIAAISRPIYIADRTVNEIDHTRNSDVVFGVMIVPRAVSFVRKSQKLP